MKAPERISPFEMIEQAGRFVSGCPLCHGAIEKQLVYVSIHYKEFEQCAGSGKVLELLIPYCPRCEPVPSDRGCLHVTYGADTLAGL